MRVRLLRAARPLSVGRAGFIDHHKSHSAEQRLQSTHQRSSKKRSAEYGQFKGATAYRSQLSNGEASHYDYAQIVLPWLALSQTRRLHDRREFAGTESSLKERL